MNEYEREVITYNSEKKMDELALKGHQWNIAEQLNGTMGKDMGDVLSGKKKVEFTFWTKVKFKINNFLKLKEDGVTNQSVLYVYLNEEEFKKVDEDLFLRNRKNEDEEFIPSEGEIDINIDLTKIIIKQKTV